MTENDLTMKCHATRHYHTMVIGQRDAECSEIIVKPPPNHTHTPTDKLLDMWS